MRKVYIAFIVLLFSFPLCTEAQSACIARNLPPNPKIEWISTVEFNASANQLLIVDPKNRALLSYQVNTGQISRVKIDVPPAQVTRIWGGFYVQSAETAAILDRGLKAVHAKINIKESRTGPGPNLGSLYSNWITRGTSFIGFGSVHKAGADIPRAPYPPDRPFQLGIITGTVSAATGKFQNIQLLEATEASDYYLLGLPYFAANDSGLFYVRMWGDHASIMQVGRLGGISELPAFPKDFRDIPPLNARADGLTAETLFSTIANSKMVAGLFGQGKFLYVLTRQLQLGETLWLLHKIDPSKPQPIGTVRVPTTAEHLSVAIGSADWLFIERGEVKSWGNQEIKRLIKVPRSWVETPDDSPLSAEKPTVTSCLTRAR